MWIWVPAEVAEAIEGVKHSITVVGTTTVVTVEYDPRAIWSRPEARADQDGARASNDTVALLEKAGFRRCVPRLPDQLQRMVETGYLRRPSAEGSVRWVWTGVCVTTDD